MKIKVVVKGEGFTSPQGETVEIEIGTSIKELLIQLTEDEKFRKHLINTDTEELAIFQVALNRSFVRLNEEKIETGLKEGDEIIIISPFGGG
ncbi:MAG: hypothetical protein VR72_02345 [Clostridiaceae bacterium BRH_c20a]|nr:MAG: hypothetical protein VR72_02345 [Clostridiaceae bacterium BRH_c20a]